MITNILKLSEIKKDPALLVGLARPAIITKYGSPLAYVLPPKRMNQLLEREENNKTLQEAIKSCKSNLQVAIREAKYGYGDVVLSHIASAIDDISHLCESDKDE
ncbi:hypothetical protein C7457_1697 [Thermovibrio guaymasensis]|uniref:Antitoxin Phd_YefM of type II toxin-antitoxin system n=1 Tax=Thermovibrio guaymasensis TaxID=240167 RepID=A0A420W5G3_9BACT|nr:hypothetical protein [Thermovibrio guaymasensis]RKQ59909.1 hypothetical protein C7457_1697 [Thermovibrio guaymasensis]